MKAASPCHHVPTLPPCGGCSIETRPVPNLPEIIVCPEDMKAASPLACYHFRQGRHRKFFYGAAATWWQGYFFICEHPKCAGPCLEQPQVVAELPAVSRAFGALQQLPEVFKGRDGCVMHAVCNHAHS